LCRNAGDLIMTFSAGGQCGGAAGSCPSLRCVMLRDDFQKRNAADASADARSQKRIPDVALSVQSKARHQPASFAVGPERLMLRFGFDRYHRVFNRFGVM
jgi:hypothetical protein